MTVHDTYHSLRDIIWQQEKTMKLYAVAYHHRFGTDVWPVLSKLNPGEVQAAVIATLSTWEGGTPPDFEDGREDEWLDITGPHDDVIEVGDPLAGYHGPSARTDEDRLQAQAEATTDDPFRDYYADEDQHGSSAITKEEKVDELVDILERSAEYWERLQQQAEATKDDPFADYHGPSAMTAEEYQAKLSEYDRNGIDSFPGYGEDRYE